MSGVVLSIPARAELLPLVRFVVSSVAARQGLSYDAIEDLCIAADEASSYLLGLRIPARRLHVEVTPGSGSVEARIWTDAAAPGWPTAEHTLARRVLSGLADEALFTSENGGPAVRLVKRAASRLEG